ncbi:fatty acyl-CoA hydrolase precursor, medium chain [Denticeps clupeoides]|uniref:Carboxylic ester hydrolase n=1 Tax=Denticeps clupeoides TaxID=299321 RepID=A0AAY4CZ79_9TELE|nr:fatty acyl-CoA hydrolase precursor, medium chain-like [Denticeps clupeoides]
MSSKQLLFCCCVAAAAALLCASDAPDGPVIKTKLGALRGTYQRVKGKTSPVHAYLGVPFAKAPVGPLRLAQPQPVQEWEGVRDATQQPYMCLQNPELVVDMLKSVNIFFELPDVSEDCLYLNVYSPSKPGEDSKLPVMVWIHGGGLSLGSASMYDGSALAAFGDVVVVLIQYRLGLLGYFSTGDDNAPGNLGFLDQVVALQWVQENIQSFGGDPASVTIFGESAGGVSVSLQVLSPLSTGLFHRAIAESGTAAMSMIFSHDPHATAKMVANITGCSSTAPDKIVDCVMQMSKEDILDIMKQSTLLHFGATVDGHFLPKPVETLLQSKDFHKVPLINGINNDEAGWMLMSFFLSDWVDGIDRETVVPLMAPFFPDPSDRWIIDMIFDEYMGTEGDRIKHRDGFRELLADLMFLVPAIQIANAQRDAGAPVYLYEFQHSFSVLKSGRPSFVKADHAEELAFVFGACFTSSGMKLNVSCTEEEEELCKTMMGYWGNFARTGSPNGPALIHWPVYGPEEDYLAIALKQKAGKRLQEHRVTFLTKTLPEKIQAARGKAGRSEL